MGPHVPHSGQHPGVRGGHAADISALGNGIVTEASTGQELYSINFKHPLNLGGRGERGQWIGGSFTGEVAATVLQERKA